MTNDTAFAELEDRLRADLPRLADQLVSADLELDPELEPELGPVASGDVRFLEPARVAPRRPRWLVPAGAVAALLLVLVGVVVAVRAGGRDESRPVDVGPPPTEGSWAPMASSPLGPREAAVSVWTGSEVIIWGGRNGLEALLDGAAYNPTTDTWRPITPNSWGHPGASGVWTGSEMVVLAKNGGAAYDPSTDSWRDLPLRQGSGSFVAPVWTGQQLVGIGLDVAVDDSGIRLAASTLADDGTAWHDDGSILLPYSVFQAFPDFSVVWTGTEAVAWDPAMGRGWAYDPATGTWRELAQARPVEGSPVSFPVVVDQELYLVAGDTQPVTTRDAGITLMRQTPDGWQAVGGDIDGLLDLKAAGVGVRGSAVVLSGPAPVRSVDVTSGAWSDIDPEHRIGWHPSTVWTGTDLVVWGGTDTVGRAIAAGWVWHPAD